MITKITSVQRLKEIFLENFVTKTDKVTKVSDGSVMNAIAYGIAKVAQKTIKDVSILESQIFPDSAYGQYLDMVANNMGIPARLGATGSSTHIRVNAAPGTIYTAGTQTFTGGHGIIFDLEEDITVGASGFAYGKIRSQQTGEKANVDPFSINQVSPVPAGHNECINEYAAQYGRDEESDDMLRSRIKNVPNIASAGTIDKMEQAMLTVNPNVLRVFYHGINESGQNVLAVASQNGANFTAAELDQLVDVASDFLSLVDLRAFGDLSDPIEIRNINWGYIDIDFRVRLTQSAIQDEVRKRIQVAISKYLDFRKWEARRKVEWDTLLNIVKNQRGVSYVPDKFFFPNSDIEVPRTYLPRLRGFIMRDVDGNVLIDNSNNVSPVFYANNSNASFQQVVIGS